MPFSSTSLIDAWPSHRTAWAVLLLVAFATRWQTLGNPVLGFDEQFYAVFADRWLHGAFPYVDIFDRKPIGLFAIFAVAQLIGGPSALAYQLAALCFAVATSFVLYRIGRDFSTPAAALTTASLYLIWLIFAEGHGGQAQVFMNLFMALAAWCTFASRLLSGKALLQTGLVAMLAVGLALQVKYTSVVEGAFFGLYLLHLAWRAYRQVNIVLAFGACWTIAALLPTAVAWGAFAAAGHADAWLFANFWSVLGKLPDGAALRNEGLIEIAIVTLPLVVLAALSSRRPAISPDTYRLAWAWLGAAVLGIVAFGSLSSPQYAMGALMPLVLVTAPAFGREWRRWTLPLFVGVGMIFAQITLARLEYFKGGAAAAAAVAVAATPRPGGCLYVYDGYPALYRLVHACTLTRYLFPGHLNTANEASARGLGVDPAVEVERIMQARPEVVVNEDPPFAGANRTTQAIVARHLAADYRLALRYRTGTDRYRLVYRLKDR